MKQFSSWGKSIIIALVILGIGGAGYYFYTHNRSNTVSPGGEQVAPTPTPAEDMTTWTDDAGFTFRYPKGLSVNKHEEDNDSYAHVELTNKDHPGKVIVWVKDLPAGVTTLDSWVKKLFSDATMLDTKLGGEPAKKIMTTAPVKMMTVGAISDNLLFSVEGTLTDSDYWTHVHDVITGSFAFTQDSSAAAPAAGSGSGSDIDEEEVVQ